MQTVGNNSAFCTRETFVKRSTKFKWFTQFGRGAGERRLGLRFRQTLAEDGELDGTGSLRDSHDMDEGGGTINAADTKSNFAPTDNFICRGRGAVVG